MKGYYTNQVGDFHWLHGPGIDNLLLAYGTKHDAEFVLAIVRRAVDAERERAARLVDARKKQLSRAAELHPRQAAELLKSAGHCHELAAAIRSGAEPDAE